jgi:hypothetical protein
LSFILIIYNDLYSTSNIIPVINSKRMIRGRGGAYRGRNYLEGRGVDGRMILKRILKNRMGRELD